MSIERIQPASGQYNKAPTGFREITEGDFAQSAFFTYGFMGVEHRQILNWPQPKAPMLHAHMYHLHDGTGFAMVNDYWGKKVRYFVFGCEHEWGGELTEAEKSVPVYNCTTKYKCKLCGYFQQIDSSD
jgi:hypothetical protein